MNSKDTRELFAALSEFEHEKGIPADYMIGQIKKAILIACKNTYNGNENAEVVFDMEKRKFSVSLIKMVVSEVQRPDYEMTLAEAKIIDKHAEIDKEVKIPLDPRDFGRIVIQTARSVIRQGIRDSEKGQMLQEFQSKAGELVNAEVERIDNKSGSMAIKVGKAEAYLMQNEQIGLHDIKEGDRVKIYVIGVKETEKGSKVLISRTVPEFVKRMFENEVPEIFDGTVEIKAISREAGARTKMAVKSKNAEVDPVGACIGARGARVSAIVNELGGEKIDIIEYSDDITKFIALALAPATVTEVIIVDEAAKSCKATVPANQLSLAIGNKGQNARLAAKLTGWKIDIRPEGGFYGENEESTKVEEIEAVEVDEAATEE